MLWRVNSSVGRYWTVPDLSSDILTSTGWQLGGDLALALVMLSTTFATFRWTSDLVRERWYKAALAWWRPLLLSHEASTYQSSR